MRIFSVPVLLGSLVLGGCAAFDPIDAFQDWDLMGSKKPLPGERRAVFPEGVPGVPKGVPPEMVKGYQAPAEAPPVVEARPARPKAQRKAAVPRRAPPPQQAEQMQEAPAAQQQTRTQPVQPGPGGFQTMPGAQPTWPSGAQPAPTR